MKFIAEINQQEYEIQLINDHQAEIDGEIHEINFESIGKQLTYSLLVDGKSFEINLYQENGTWEVILRGRRYTVRVEDERERLLRSVPDRSNLEEERYCLQSPMPGLVISIPVNEGQQVTKGDVLLILESMKMQNELTAPRDGTVTEIRVEINENVERKQTLVIVE